MRKRATKYLLSAVAGVTIGATIGATISVTMTQIALRRMRPPLFQECRQIQTEIYAKWLSDGVLPAPGALSASAQKMLSENRGIQYTVKDGLSYKYDKPYPINVPFTGLITFGLLWGGEDTCVGRSQSPEVLIHNAKLRAKKPR